MPANFTVNQGTNIELYAGSLTGGTIVGIMRLDIGTGATASPWGGTTIVGTVLGAGTLSNVGSVNTVTTVSNVTNGSINVLGGTVNVGTFVMPTGTITTGSLTNVANLINGSVNILTGTIQSSGTTTGVGVVSNLTNGSVNVLTGTVNVGTVTAYGNAAPAAARSGNPIPIAGTDAGGTVYIPLVDTTGVSRSSGSQVITVGTISKLPSDGTITQVTTVSNLTNGSVNILTGTIQSSGTTTGVGVVSNLTNGSVNLLTGTVTSVTNLAGGTVRIDPTSVQTTLTHGTLGTAGGSFFATISAASGAGTKHYISGLQVVGQSGTADVRILVGTAIQGAGVLAGGITVPGGGFVRDFNKDYQTAANSEITYHFVGAGTAFITVNYWKGA